MDKKTAITVEKHDELAKSAPRMMAVAGLEDIPTSMIPVPIYKLVQPGSTNTAMADGKDAPIGTILMKDNSEAVETLKFLLIRAKRQTRTFVDDDGVEQQSPVIAVLGLNIDRDLSPFVLSLPVSSFSTFGQLMAQIKDAKATSAWEYPIKITSEKKEMEKNTTSGRKMVKFYVLNFALGKTATSEEDIKTAQLAYDEFAASLDRGQTNEEKGVVEVAKDPQVQEAEQIFNSKVPTVNGDPEEESDIPF